MIIASYSCIVYPSLMDRSIKVIGEKEERMRALLLPIEKETKEKARIKYSIITPLYNGLFFAHMDRNEKLGAFIPGERIIILSEELLDYPLSVIRNVYIHECAHAVDYMLNPSMTGHSAIFREIADNLGIDKGFEKARLKDDLLKKEKTREKVEKLIALSSSSFENEAVSALKKARELIEKSALNEKIEEDKIYHVDLYESKRISTYILYITYIVSENTGSFIVKDHTQDSVFLTSYGSLEQCESSLYLFDYLFSILEIEVQRLRREGKKVTKDSFMAGVYDALIKKTASSEDTSLVKSIKEETKEKAKKIAFKDTKLRTTTNKVHLDKNSFSSGSSFGKDIDLSGGRQKKIGQ